MPNPRHELPSKRPTKLSIPEQAVPHVRFMFAEMGRQRVTYEDLEWKSGILKNTLKAWRHKNQPNLANIEACLNALGYALVPVPAESVIPADIVAELRPIADRLGLTMPRTLELLTEIMARGSRFTGKPTPRLAVVPKAEDLLLAA